jgi:2-amino-4-hydroxy-6-hydroxymethyldihydropteridine diphosphokinase
MRAGIALGSNLGERLLALEQARIQLLQLPGVTGPLISSKLYETDPVDTGTESGPFLNAVVEVDYSGQAYDLLEGLQSIENGMGRPSKRPRNAPRTIDLDILYLGNLTLSTPEIVIPHPRLHLRRFVLAPLNDIRPDLILPGQHRCVGDLLASLTDPASVELAPRQWNLQPMFA